MGIYHSPIDFTLQNFMPKFGRFFSGSSALYFTRLGVCRKSENRSLKYFKSTDFENEKGVVCGLVQKL